MRCPESVVDPWRSVVYLRSIPSRVAICYNLRQSTTIRSSVLILLPSLIHPPSSAAQCCILLQFATRYSNLLQKRRPRRPRRLKALLIIPRSPSPVPLEEREINTLNPEEMRELLKRQKVYRENTRRRIWTYRNQQRADQARKVKVEGIKREYMTDTTPWTPHHAGSRSLLSHAPPYAGASQGGVKSTG